MANEIALSDLARQFADWAYGAITQEVPVSQRCIYGVAAMQPRTPMMARVMEDVRKVTKHGYSRKRLSDSCAPQNRKLAAARKAYLDAVFAAAKM